MPEWWTTARNKLRALLTRAAREREMDEELRFHVEMEAAELQRAGVPPEEAGRRARALFGSVERTKDDARDVVGVRLLDDLVQDLHYARRQLRASPGFTAATILTLSLGIGATTTVYTIARTIAVPPLQLPRGDALVHVAQGRKGDCLACGRMTSGNFLTVRDESRTLVDATLIAEGSKILRGPETTEAVRTTAATPTFFQMLGVPAMLGRTIVPADSAGDARVVVLSEAFWRARFGGDSAIVGSTIVLDAQPFTVIGVVADRFVFPRGTMLWTVRTLTASDRVDRLWTDYQVVARLKPGVALSRARAELATIGARLEAAYPETMRGWAFDVMPFGEWEAPKQGVEFTTIELTVALVLLVACINLAGLLLARLTVREREIAVRAALGAGAGRLARQLLTELLTLTLVGGVGGAAVAGAAVRAVRGAMPLSFAESVAGWASMHVDVRAVLVAVATGAVTGLLIGLWPARRSARPALVASLKNGARSATLGGDASRARRGLVVAEVALAIVLLAAATLLARSLRNLHRVTPGFRADHVLTLRLTAPGTGTKEIRLHDSLAFERLRERLRQLPGVQSAAGAFGIPYSHWSSTNRFAIEGHAVAAVVDLPSVRMAPVTVDYFATLGIPVLRGRAFEASDRPDAPRVAIVDETVARRFFPNEDPVGRVVVIDSARWRVVGVVGDTRWDTRRATTADSPGEIYRPMAQWPRSSVQLVVRTLGEPTAAAPSIVRAIHDFDRDLAVTGIQSLESLVDDDVARDRLVAGMMTAFAVVAVLIAAIGLYGVISYGVAQRTREFGIRRALGAEPGALLGQVLGQGARLAGAGALLGVSGALALARLLRAMLFGISATDPVTLAAVVVAMCSVGVAAAYLPARRASRVDPMVSLREE